MSSSYAHSESSLHSPRSGGIGIGKPVDSPPLVSHLPVPPHVSSPSSTPGDSSSPSPTVTGGHCPLSSSRPDAPSSAPGGATAGPAQATQHNNQAARARPTRREVRSTEARVPLTWNAPRFRRSDGAARAATERG